MGIFWERKTFFEHVQRFIIWQIWTPNTFFAAPGKIQMTATVALSPPLYIVCRVYEVRALFRRRVQGDLGRPKVTAGSPQGHRRSPCSPGASGTAAGPSAFYFLPFFCCAARGGVTGRPEFSPPYGNFFLSAGFNIWKEHMSVSSTDIMAPALSNSPQ